MLYKSISYLIDVNEDVITVAHNGNQHTVLVKYFSCNCGFSTTMQLPCRHQFAARSKCGARDFDVSQVRERWLKSYQLRVGVHQEEFANCQDEASLRLRDPNEAVISVLGKSSGFSGTLGKNQKYQKMLTLTQRLAVVGSEYGMKEFKKKYAEVEELLHCWEENIPVIVTPSQETSQVRVHL